MVGTEEKLITQYHQNMSVYEGLKKDIADIIQRIVSSNQIRLSSFQIRIKKEEALKNKILYKQKYQEINDITDIVACRCITLFESDLDILTNLIFKNFDVCEYSDKRKKQNKSNIEFGYNSLHLICKFTDERCKLVEYEPYKGIRFEIQIRTTLQHSWAEIEHGLGYKSQYEIPKDIRRKLTRLSANLEILDEEFVTIEKEIREYNESLIKREKVLKTDINKTSLINYALGSKMLNRMVNTIAKTNNLKINYNPELISQLRLVRRMNYLGYLDVPELNEFMEGNYDTICVLGEQWCKYISKDKDEVNFYACLLWINLVMLIESEQGSIDELLTKELIDKVRPLEYIENVK